MKLRQLQCLCAVVDCGFNISRAAKHLHATQPAVSKQLRLLENELGIALIVRHGDRAVGLTPLGERALLWARQSLRSAENIRVLSREGADDAGGMLVLASSHSHSKHLLLPALQAFCGKFPRIRVTVIQRPPDEAAELVRDGKAAIAVTHSPANLPRETVAIPFLTSDRMLVMPTGHPLLRVKELTLESIAPYPLIMQRTNRPDAPQIDRQFEDAGLPLHIAVQAIDTDVIKTYVAAGLGVGIIYEFAYNPKADRGVRVRNVGHLFAPSSSTVVVRRDALLPKFAYEFLECLHPSLDRSRMESIVFGSGPDVP